MVRILSIFMYAVHIVAAWQDAEVQLSHVPAHAPNLTTEMHPYAL